MESPGEDEVGGCLKAKGARNGSRASVIEPERLVLVLQFFRLLVWQARTRAHQ